jgi:hypothetical protein
MLSTKLVLTDFEYDKKVKGLHNEWIDIETQRNLAYLQALNEHDSETRGEDSEQTRQA